MTGDRAIHRLDGLEPDNLLAFLSILGLLRVIEEVRPDWRPRIFWMVEPLPIRPALCIPGNTAKDTILEVVAKGLSTLALHHEFEGFSKFDLDYEAATKKLRDVAFADCRYIADLWAALICNVAIDSKKGTAERTPLCLLHGQGHQHFLPRLSSVPQESAPFSRGSGRSKILISDTECLREALFQPWKRLDNTKSFRWDPHEARYYALRAKNPAGAKDNTTQHGANRLATIGLSVLTVVPQKRGNKVRLAVLGGKHQRGGKFSYVWPIWRHPLSLAGISALLSHPFLDCPITRTALGVIECRSAQRIQVDKYFNFTKGTSLPERKIRPAHAYRS